MMPNEIQPYVKISTLPDGYLLVETMAEMPIKAVDEFSQTVQRLKDAGFRVATSKSNEIKVTNENTRCQPQVTIKGSDESVISEFLLRTTNEVIPK